MGHYQVQAPDGHTYEFEAPDDATPQQLDAMTREVAGYAKQYPVTTGKTPQPESVGGQLLDATKNTAAGLAEGAAALPDMAATAVGKAASVIPNLISEGLKAAGHHDAADWIQANITHPLANPAQIGNAVESVAPTPDTTSAHVARFLSQLTGGAAAMPASAMDNIATRFIGEVPKGFKPAAAPDAASVVQDAKDAGVRVLTSDIAPPRTFIGKFLTANGERVPFAGTGGVRAAQQAERVQAVKNVAQEYGAASGDELASPAIDEVAKDLANTRSAMLTKLTKQKNAVIDGVQGAVPVPKAINAIDEQIGKLNAINSDAYEPVVNKLLAFRNQLSSGKTLSQIEGNRKLLGDMFSDPSLTSLKGDGEKALNAIYGPLREDMGAFIKANGQPGDFNKWKNANDILSGLAGQLKNTALKKALTTAETTPENVASLLFSSKPSDVQLLYRGLTPAGRSKAQAAILQKAIEKSGGMENISADRFSNQVKSLGKSVGVFFQGKERAQIDGLARVLDATKRAATASVMPPTGAQAFPAVITAVLSDELGGAIQGLSAYGASGLLARAYESAPVRNLLVRLGKSKQGSPEEAMLLKRTGSAIVAGARNHASSTVLNDNVATVSSAAASPSGTDPNSEQ
jgi:hypothetical protein